VKIHVKNVKGLQQVFSSPKIEQYLLATIFIHLKFSLGIAKQALKSSVI
jgi:hypothetical protein